MIIVRNIFIAKPGNASKLAALFKTAATAGKLPRHRVLTDMTGDSNRVILEYEVPSVAEFEAVMKNYASNEEMRSVMKGYTDMYLTATRELLQTA